MKMPEPVSYWIPDAEQFCIPKNGGRPFAKAWQPLYDKQALIDLLESAANLSERLWPDEKRSGHEWTDGFADGTCGAADAIRKLKETL